MLELDLTIDQHEAIVAAALALYAEDIELPQESRSLEPEVMNHLALGLLALGQIDAEITAQITTPACMVCREASVVELTMDEYLALTEKREDGRPAHLIQNALPNRDAEFRELVKTGIHPVCWTSIFGPNAED